MSNLGLQIQSKGKYIQFLNALEENHFLKPKIAKFCKVFPSIFEESKVIIKLENEK